MQSLRLLQKVKEAMKKSDLPDAQLRHYGWSVRISSNRVLVEYNAPGKVDVEQFDKDSDTIEALLREAGFNVVLNDIDTEVDRAGVRIDVISWWISDTSGKR